LNVQTFKRQNGVLKIWQLIGGPLPAGALSHGTTGTMDNPALFIGHVLPDERHCPGAPVVMLNVKN